MFLVGLTGGIASGKSTVAKMFADSGLPIVDADTIARRVVEPGRKAWHKLRREFGDEIFHEDGKLNREKLGEIIFSDTNRRRKLNSITHPEIIKEMIFAAIKLGFQGHPFIILDIPLLYETGELVNFMYKIIVVNASSDLRLERLIARSNLTTDDAQKRISCQMSLDSKCQMADFVIENSGHLNETKEQVDKIIRDLKCLKYHYKIRFYIVVFLCVVTFGITKLVILFKN